jgi:hypothetical protein
VSKERTNIRLVPAMSLSEPSSTTSSSVFFTVSRNQMSSPDVYVMATSLFHAGCVPFASNFEHSNSQPGAADV